MEVDGMKVDFPFWNYFKNISGSKFRLVFGGIYLAIGMSNQLMVTTPKSIINGYTPEDAHMEPENTGPLEKGPIIWTNSPFSGSSC